MPKQRKHMRTHISKSAYGTWMAITMMQINEKLHLTLTTMKRHDKNITTTVSVEKQEQYFFVHDPFKDFKKTLISSSDRCTKPAVERQHSAAIAMLDSIKEQAINHYN